MFITKDKQVEKCRIAMEAGACCKKWPFIIFKGQQNNRTGLFEHFFQKQTKLCLLKKFYTALVMHFFKEYI